MTTARTLLPNAGRVLVMGIVNRTPDSFSDGGAHLDEEAARAQVERLVREGADIIDVGAESTRPGAKLIDAATQLARLGELIPFVVRAGVVASVDTTLAEVAEHALRQGAAVVNSVSLAPAAELGGLAARFGASLVLTHCRGAMTDMRAFSEYDARAYGDVVREVADEWTVAAQRAMAAGLPRESLWFDPGLGFAKNAEQSLELCVRLGELKALVRHPVLVGPSRKSYLASAVAREARSPNPPPNERLGGTIAAVLDAAAQGADAVRVHDVQPVAQALSYRRAMLSPRALMSKAVATEPRAGGGADA